MGLLICRPCLQAGPRARLQLTVMLQQFVIQHEGACLRRSSSSNGVWTVHKRATRRADDRLLSPEYRTSYSVSKEIVVP